jgi:endonuclease G
MPKSATKKLPTPARLADKDATLRAPARFLHNDALRAEVIQLLSRHWPQGRRKWADVTLNLADRFSVLKNLPKAVVVQPDETAPPRDFRSESLDKPNLHLESIVLPLSRPVLFVQDNDFGTAPLKYWQDRLDPARGYIKPGIPAVGRIELKNHDSYAWNGTAWLVRPNVAVTNRHVALAFAAKQNGRWVFSTNSVGKYIQSKIDFREEYQRPDEEELDVVGILHVEEGDNPDIALLQVKPDPARGNGIPLAKAVAANTEIVTIGYPKYDSSIPDPEMLIRIFGGIYDVKRLSPGVVTEATPNLLKHDCSTLGGNSGSAMISLATGEAVGLHFGGSYKISNFAVPAPVIFNLLTNLGL